MPIGVLFRSVVVVLGGVKRMAMGDVGMVGRFFMLTCFRMFSGFSVMHGSMVVMFSRLLVMFVNCVLFHDEAPDGSKNYPRARCAGRPVVFSCLCERHAPTMRAHKNRAGQFFVPEGLTHTFATDFHGRITHSREYQHEAPITAVFTSRWHSPSRARLRWESEGRESHSRCCGAETAD
jgi:hypothetical protein